VIPQWIEPVNDVLKGQLNLETNAPEKRPLIALER
jgi:hypothetical protein